MSLKSLSADFFPHGVPSIRPCVDVWVGTGCDSPVKESPVVYFVELKLTEMDAFLPHSSEFTIAHAAQLTDTISLWLQAKGEQHDGSLDWAEISLALNDKHQLGFSADACSQLWKFLAYGRWITMEELKEYESDEEEFVTKLNEAEFLHRQHLLRAKKRARERESRGEESNTSDAERDEKEPTDGENDKAEEDEWVYQRDFGLKDGISREILIHECVNSGSSALLPHTYWNRNKLSPNTCQAFERQTVQSVLCRRYWKNQGKRSRAQNISDVRAATASSVSRPQVKPASVVAGQPLAQGAALVARSSAPHIHPNAHAPVAANMTAPHPQAAIKTLPQQTSASSVAPKNANMNTQVPSNIALPAGTPSPVIRSIYYVPTVPTAANTGPHTVASQRPHPGSLPAPASHMIPAHAVPAHIVSGSTQPYTASHIVPVPTHVVSHTVGPHHAVVYTASPVAPHVFAGYTAQGYAVPVAVPIAARPPVFASILPLRVDPAQTQSSTGTAVSTQAPFPAPVNSEQSSPLPAAAVSNDRSLLEVAEFMSQGFQK